MCSTTSLSQSPTYFFQPAATVTEPPTSDDLESTVSQLSLEEVEKHTSSGATFKPSRRVREKPGGQDTVSQLFSDDVEDIPEIVKPSRRVRTVPGGESSGVSIFILTFLRHSLFLHRFLAKLRANTITITASIPL